MAPSAEKFTPTLLGFIEGPPPVPSENLTVEESYDGTAAIQLNSTENVSYSWTRAQEAGLGIEVDAILGSAAEVSAGLIVMTSLDGGLGITGFGQGGGVWVELTATVVERSRPAPNGRSAAHLPAAVWARPLKNPDERSSS